MEKLKFELNSECPILCHNGQLSDPMNYYAKEMKKLSGKRGKTDADFEQLARIEWYGSLYLDSEQRICIPSDVLEPTLVNGARKLKLGKQAQAGIFITKHCRLEFDGDDLSIDDLWKRDQNRFTKAVKIGTAKVMRTRFRVDTWKATVEVAYDPGLLNPSQVIEIVRISGEIIGLCDWRPKFGRFTSNAL